MCVKMTTRNRLNKERERMSDLDDLRREILYAMLPHVAFDGWTRKALNAGARDAGQTPEAAEHAFIRGLNQVAEFYSADADAAMCRALEEKGVGELPIRQRIALAVRTRLEQAAPHREAIRHLMSYLALPGAGLTGARCTLRTVDAMWYAAGDTSTDFNYYTKRGLLAAVYGATVLYWLNDASDDCEATWAFLDRRIADVMQVPKFQGQIAKIAERFPSPLRLREAFTARRSRNFT